MAGNGDPEVDSVAADLGAAWDAADSEIAGDVEGQEAPASAEGRARDELGRFAPKESPAEEPLEPGDRSAGSDAPSATQSPQAVQPAQPTHPQTPGAQPQFAPPPGWSIAAKQEWDRLPEHVRAAVAEREVQVNQGFAKLQEYRGLEPFTEIARANNTTLPQALERYIAAEEFLTRDPINGIRELCRMYGVAPAQIAGMEDASGDAAAGYQTPRPQIDPMVYQLANEINALKSAVASREQGEVQSVLSQFAADPRHRYFDNVRQVMGVLMQTGQANDLEAAYETACWANPQIRQALINEQAEARRQSSEQAARNAASKARSAGRSIAGAPNGSVPNAPDRTLREELEANWPA